MFPRSLPSRRCVRVAAAELGKPTSAAAPPPPCPGERRHPPAGAWGVQWRWRGRLMLAGCLSLLFRALPPRRRAWTSCPRTWSLSDATPLLQAGLLIITSLFGPVVDPEVLRVAKARRVAEVARGNIHALDGAVRQIAHKGIEVQPRPRRRRTAIPVAAPAGSKNRRGSLATRPTTPPTAHKRTLFRRPAAPPPSRGGRKSRGGPRGRRGRPPARRARGTARRQCARAAGQGAQTARPRRTWQTWAGNRTRA